MDVGASLQESIVASGILNDPFANGRLRFREAPVVLSAAEASELAVVAESIALVYDELVKLVIDDPPAFDEFFQLTPCQKLMALASAPLWHGVARADVFRTERGLVITELNSDTPTGEPEAVVLGRLAKRARPELIDPNEGLADRFVGMVDAVAKGNLGDSYEKTIAVVYPTDIPEDLSLVRLYESWFEPRGYRVLTGSPFNLRTRADGAVTLFGEVVSVVLRHYKTDWWGERFPVWSDEEPFVDPFPLVGPLETLIAAEARRRVVVVNPFGSVITQNKRSLAYMWERSSRFSSASQAIIRAHVPETLRLESMHPEQLAVEREDWVLKSDYGCEGDEVICGRDVTPEQWTAALALALPGRWVVQRAFTALPNDDGSVVNLGVYVVAGEAAGLYGRIEHRMPERFDESAPVLVAP